MKCAMKGWPAFRSLNASFAAATAMRYVLVVGIVAAATPLRAVAADPSGAKADDRDVPSIVADGVIRVAMTRFDLPGFHKRNVDGSMDGLEADLARAIARALKVRVVLNADYGSFDTVADAVASGRADIGISKLSDAANGAAPEDVLRNFRGKIGVIGASAYVDFAHRNFPNAQIVPLEHFPKRLNRGFPWWR
jgi:ABC-type amino acid transport substrate-binding protein